MAKRGPVSSYKPEYCAHALRLCSLGGINRELAEFFGVSERTIGNWLARYPDFKEAVRHGRMTADAVIAEALYEKAKGYERPATKIVEIDGKPREVHYIEHLPPDTRACMFWLRHRRPQDWDEKREPPRIDIEACLAELEAAGERARRAKEKPGETLPTTLPEPRK